MKLVKSKVEILDRLDGDEILRRIEQVARTCYKSEDKITKDSAKKLVTNLVKSGHEAMLEFVDVTVKFICDRGVSHELVRHRLASFAQESTRYCNYDKDKFGNELTFIIPSWLDIPEGNYTYWDGDWVDIDKLKIQLPDDDGAISTWLFALAHAETSYRLLIDKDWKAQQARMVLPMSIKTEINMKCNLREWRHFFKLRCSTAAHPDIRILAIKLLKLFYAQIPVIFDDLYTEFCTK